MNATNPSSTRAVRAARMMFRQLKAAGSNHAASSTILATYLSGEARGEVIDFLAAYLGRTTAGFLPDIDRLECLAEASGAHQARAQAALGLLLQARAAIAGARLLVRSCSVSTMPDRQVCAGAVEAAEGAIAMTWNASRALDAEPDMGAARAAIAAARDDLSDAGETVDMACALAFSDELQQAGELFLLAGDFLETAAAAIAEAA